MDRFNAHMDRSWDLISRGEVTTAMIAARQALALDRENPEVHNLLGYIHAVGGDFEDAIECYRRAIDLDEWYLEPILNAAELLVHPEADPDEAIRLCHRASEMVNEPRELADITLIEVDALLNTGREGMARECLVGLEDAENLPGPYQVVLGRIFYDLGDLDRAKPFVKRALESDESLPDAWYCSGLIARDEGRRIDAVKGFVATRYRDLGLPRLPWTVPDDELEKMAIQAIGSSSERIRAALAGVKISVEDYPSEEQIRAEVDPRQVVLAAGIDAKRGVFENLYIFSINLERVAPPSFMLEELTRLVEAEVGGDQNVDN